MGIAFRYVSRELLAVFFVTALVLLVIALGGRFMGYLQDAAVGKHSADALLRIIALRVPGFLQLTLPFSFYIALVLTAARLYADQEMTVLVTSGSSPSQVLLWIGVSASRGRVGRRLSVGRSDAARARQTRTVSLGGTYRA